MTWLEIVNLRTAGKTEFMEAFNFCCRMQQNLEAGGSVAMHVYRNISYETDFSIHLYWDSAMAGPTKTDVGIQLSNSLTRFGLTDHKVWQPMHC
jgi:hypothetical protein